MEIEIAIIGGSEEVGRRLTAVRVGDDIHVSGHLRKEGHYQMLDALQPHHIIPAHRDLGGFSGYVDLATDRGTSSVAIST